MVGEYVCIYTHAHTYIYVYIYTYSHMHTLKHTYISDKGVLLRLILNAGLQCYIAAALLNTCTHVCMRICAYVCMYALIIYIYKGIFICSQANITLFLLIMLPHFQQKSRKRAELIPKIPRNGISRLSISLEVFM